MQSYTTSHIVLCVLKTLFSCSHFQKQTFYEYLVAMEIHKVVLVLGVKVA